MPRFIDSNKELHYSGLTVISVALGPLSFLTLQNQNVPMWISFSTFFGFCALGFYFQTLRRRETRRLRKLRGQRSFAYQVGDEVRFQGEGFVVLKHGFNHYYLRDLKNDQIILVKRQRVEYDGRDGIPIRTRETQAQRSF